MSLVVGFDLDLTLVDSADGIIATYVEAGRRLGVKVDPEVVRPLIGIPLEDGIAQVVPTEQVEDMVRIYREIFPAVGIPGTTLMPGAAEAVACVREHGGRTVVISAKIEPGVSLVLDYVGLSVDEVVGGCYAEAKGEALRERGATTYVGDHPGDMRGAQVAGATAVGVTTGGHDALALREAGAEVILADLLDFPYWLTDYLAA